MTWAWLLIIISYGQPAKIQTVPFQTQAACELVLKRMQSMRALPDTEYFCIEDKP